MLIAPLDWGLGHATRCIPVIKKLLNAGFKVIIAAERDQKILFTSVFPELEIVHLKGYRLKYGSTKTKTILKIIFQIPKILTAINHEKKWLRNFITDKHLDMVIADNRFGLHHKNIIAVFITHQLHIKTSLGKFADLFIQKINYYFINQFNYCWVPDAATAENLAGELSHPLTKPLTTIFYTGILSAINKRNISFTHKLLILLSGPEPQRSILEDLLLKQLEEYTLPVVLVRGLPAATATLAAPASCKVYNYLSGALLEQVINQSEIILCRSGYSTIMDVLPLQKKCIFIPTPGQAEQQYLATYLSNKQYACTGHQQKFSLVSLIAAAEKIQLPDLAVLKNDAALENAIAALQTK